MKLLSFSNRVVKETVRDPLNLAFGIGFPVILLLLLSAIQTNVPVDLFEISRLAPGICVFGLSFMTLFSALLVSKDRESALLQRLYTTPLTAADFILGYIIPMLPMALVQCAVCFAASLALGLELSIKILYSIISIIPAALFFISLGLLCGSVMNSKQVGGICGALLTNLAAWLSGAWFDLELVGGAFKAVADVLPYAHAVELQRAVLAGNFDGIVPHLHWVIGYAIVATFGAVILFLRQMKRN